MKQLRLKRGRPSHLGTARWAVAGLAALAITVWVVGASVGRRESAAKSLLDREGRRPHLSLGFRLQQWQADSRTLIAVVRYMLEPDQAPPSPSLFSPIVTNPVAPALAMPTNEAALAPKALRPDSQTLASPPVAR